jgi:hypothetical protein
MDDVAGEIGFPVWIPGKGHGGSFGAGRSAKEEAGKRQGVQQLGHNKIPWCQAEAQAMYLRF